MNNINVLCHFCIKKNGRLFFSFTKVENWTGNIQTDQIIKLVKTIIHGKKKKRSTKLGGKLDFDLCFFILSISYNLEVFPRALYL